MLAARATHGDGDESLPFPQVAVPRCSYQGSQMFQKRIRPVSCQDGVGDRGVKPGQIP